MSDKEKSRTNSPEPEFIEDDVNKDHLTIEVPQLGKTSRSATPPPSSSSVKPQDQVQTSKKTERTTSPVYATRSTSPSEMPCDITLKFNTQFTRIDTLDEIMEQIPNITSLTELNVLEPQALEVHKAFAKDHAYLDARCTSQFMNSNYFKTNLNSREAKQYIHVTMALARKREQLTPRAIPPIAITSSTKPQLPQLQVPTFSGDYQAWPEFKQLFTSIVGSSTHLSNIEKLHYLKLAVKGSAANLISNLPMTDDTFDEAWEKLIQKFENKRKLLFGHVHSILTEVKISKNMSTSAHLTAIVEQIENALSAIKLMGHPIDNWDVIIIHQIVKQLDDVTRERWESKLGDNQVIPTYHELKTFIAHRIHTLENLETSTNQRSIQSTSSPRPPKASVSNITTSSKYICDCCGQNHFIVSCTTFRALSPDERYEIIKKKSLCFNCMGRHSVRSCRMSMTCTVCKKNHHTMIHAAITSQPSTSTATSEK